MVETIECSGFWKLYLDYLLSKQGGLFIFQCNYDVNQKDIPSTFYNELLSWWSDLRESANPERGYKFILWNNKDILIEDKTVFIDIILIMVLFLQRTCFLIRQTLSPLMK